MLAGHFGIDNIVFFVGGLVSVIIGAAVLRNPSGFGRTADSIQRRLGNSLAPRGVKHIVIAGVGFVAFGLVFTIVSLIVDMQGSAQG